VLPVVLIGLTVPNLFALAQEQQSPYGNRDKRESYGVYSPPAVFATDLLYNQKQGRGYFTILNNSDDVVSDIIYRVEILGELLQATSENPVVEDNANLFYRKTVDTQVYALESKEKKFIEFQFVAPDLSNGKYRLRIQITSPNGGDLGWKDTNFEITGKSTAFLDAVTGTIVVPEYGETLIPPMSGPNVTANSEIKFNATVENKGSAKLSATPVVQIFKMDNSLFGEQRGAETSFVGRKEIFVQTSVTTPTEPGAYYAQLTWRDNTNQQISPLLEYRIVVKGESARITGLRVKNYKLEDNKLPVIVEVVGPADAVTTMKGKLGLEIKDIEGVLGSFIVPDELTLDDALTSGTAMVPVQRSSRGQVVLTAVLKGLDGKVLDTYEINIEPLRFTEKAPTNATRSKVTVISYGILSAIIIVVLIAVGVMALFFKKYKINWKFLGLFILILLPIVVKGVYAAGSGGIEVLNPVTTYDITADWRPLGRQPVIALFVNEPIHNNTYQKNSVPVSYRVEWAVCKNWQWFGDVNVHYLKTGGKISTFKPSAGSIYERIAHNSWNTNCTTETSLCFGCSADRCMTGRNFAAPSVINLSQLISSATDTTMRFFARWQPNWVFWTWTEAASDYTYLASNSIGSESNARNIWLNILSLQCTASNPTPVIGEAVNFNVAGGNGTYNWTNTEGTPGTGTGLSFSASFGSIGTKTINVQDTSGLSGNCKVNVDYAQLVCTAVPNPTNVESSTRFTVTGGNLIRPVFRFLDGATLLQELTVSYFDKIFTTAGTKTLTAQRCDISTPTAPPASCVPIAKTVSGTGDSTVSITTPCDGTLNVKTADDKLLTSITKVENGQTQYVAICDNEGVKDWCGGDTGGGQCCTVPSGGKVDSYQSLICGRDGTFIAVVPKEDILKCPGIGSLNYPIAVKAGDIITMRQTKSGSKSSITFTPATLPVPNCESTPCTVVVNAGPLIKVFYGGPGGVRVFVPSKDSKRISVNPNTTRTFYVENNGNQPLVVSGITTPTTSGPGIFSATKTTGFTVPVGGTETFTVSMGNSPAETLGLLRISNNTPTNNPSNNPYEINLTSAVGVDEGPGPEVSLKINESTQPDKGTIIIPRGQGVTLVWNVKEVASCTASSTNSASFWVTKPDSAGIKTIASGDNTQRIDGINATTSYSLNCIGNNGSAAGKTVTVTVLDTSSGTNIRDL